MTFNLDNLSETRRSIVLKIKRRKQTTIETLANQLNKSPEAIRQQLTRLEKDGWIRRTRPDDEQSRPGRPTSYYELTQAGEHLFPKNYEGLSIELIDTILEREGQEGLRNLLAAMTETRVNQWAPQLEGLSLDEKVEKLQDIYRQDDDQMQHVTQEDGTHLLIENNCPFLNVAAERPALCSLTISTLSRLLEAGVTRTERFQDGDGRCVFEIDPTESAISGPFEFEQNLPDNEQ